MPAAPLHYVQDDAPGWKRVFRGGDFVYLNARGAEIRSAAHLERVRGLAIPPAYTEVWICPSARGHLQATGRDARGRKQYRYHPDWQARQEQHKFDRMREFGRNLSRIRRAVTRDLKGRAVTRRTVIAAIVRLLDRTALRVGNAEYAATNRSYGLTTLRDHHVRVRADELAIRFRGKGGTEQHARLNDKAAARVVRRCQELPGQQLFQYVDDEGRRHDVRSQHVNDYLREVSGHDFTAKDFRTWHASVLALELVAGGTAASASDPVPSRRTVVEVVREVARQIGNTQAVCRRFYIHPAVLELLRDTAPRQEADGVSGSTERALLRLLSRRKRRASGR